VAIAYAHNLRSDRHGLLFVHATMPISKDSAGCHEMNNKFAVSSIGYDLSLSDGNQWHLNADAPLLPWIDKFAAIMKLNKSPLNGNLKLTYSFFILFLFLFLGVRCSAGGGFRICHCVYIS
jgi:hypothetical protein